MSFVTPQFPSMGKWEKETLEERQSKQGSSPSKRKEGHQLLQVYRKLRVLGLAASIPLWIAAIKDPLGAREDVIDFLVNGPKRYRRFRRRFTRFIIELYTLAAETAPQDSTERTVLKSFLHRLEAVRTSQFPE